MRNTKFIDLPPGQSDFLDELESQDNGARLLQLLIEIYDQKNLALKLSELGIEGLDRETLNKWKKDPKSNPIKLSENVQRHLRHYLLPEKPAHYDNPDFTFIDLFAGIGGIRRGFEAIGGRCEFTSEWDAYARRTYLANNYVEEAELPYFLDTPETNAQRNSSFQDITKITLSGTSASDKDVAKSINFHVPDHDVLLAGFPCQPFSIAGVSKKNALGRSHGFECETQGTLFFDIEKILEVKKPKFFVLENVKNLKSHDKGNTFAVIIRTLDRLGYYIADISDADPDIEKAIAKVRKRKPEPTVIDAKYFLPQHRERIVLVGVRKDLNHDGLTLNKVYDFTPKKKVTVSQVLDKEVPSNYILTPKLWNYLFNYAIKHQKKGNGFGFGLIDPNIKDSVTRTLSARYYKDGSEILINHQGIDSSYLETAKEDPSKNFDPLFKTPRRLTPRECARLMGFEDIKNKKEHQFRIPVSDTRAYKQFGNSVVAPVFRAVAETLKPFIMEAKKD